MDCALIEPDLLAHCLDAIEDDDARERIDAHLLGCTTCLRAFLKTKRALQRGADVRPSPAARARLREAVIATFRPRPLDRVRDFFARPIPLYQGLAVAVVVVLLALLAPLLRRSRDTPARPTEHAARGLDVDTARPSSETVHLY